MFTDSVIFYFKGLESNNKYLKKYTMQEEFKWTDDLVLEFVRYTLTDSPTYQSRYADLESFKKHPVFITKDKQDISSKTEDVFIVDPDFDLISQPFHYYQERMLMPGFVCFKFKSNAIDYIVNNCPCLSILDLEKIPEISEYIRLKVAKHVQNKLGLELGTSVMD